MNKFKQNFKAEIVHRYKFFTEKLVKLIEMPVMSRCLVYELKNSWAAISF